MQDLEKLKYPTGTYQVPPIIDEDDLKRWISDLAILPQQIIEITKNLSEQQLEIPYRPYGWTVRQVVHHLADSHINAYTRVHLTLTETRPEVRPYDEVKWAELSVAKTGDIQLSIEILKAIHQRLVSLLETLSFDDFQRTYYHPAVGKEFTLAYLVGNYAWHGKHHLAHINLTLK
jgi:hypothetical protein